MQLGLVLLLKPKFGVRQEESTKKNPNRTKELSRRFLAVIRRRRIRQSLQSALKVKRFLLVGSVDRVSKEGQKLNLKKIKCRGNSVWGFVVRFQRIVSTESLLPRKNEWSWRGESREEE